MAGALVRTSSFIKQLLNPAICVLASIPRPISCGCHLQKTRSPNLSVAGGYCSCQKHHHVLVNSSSWLRGNSIGNSCCSYTMSLCLSKNELDGRVDRAGRLGVNHKTSACVTQVRNKSRGRQEDDDNEEDDSDEDDALEDDDFEAPPQFKVMKISASSNRADAVISQALNIGRNQIEEIFLKSGLYLNGEKLLKKSVKMDPGDYADVTIEKTEDQLKVKRVKLLKIYPEKTSKDRMILKVRVWKSPFLLPKPEFRPHNS